MSEKPLDSPSDFAQQVRDALTHLHDPGHLQVYPLVRFLRAEAGSRPSGLGRALRQAILDAVETLRPGPEAAPTSRASRTYQILKLRFVDGLEVSQVLDRLSVSKSVYYVEQQRAIEAVISVLRERWGLAEPGEAVAQVGAGAGGLSASRVRVPRIGGAVASNLPLQLTRFVGREQEMAEVKGLLRTTRLLTLSGTGGCGKTRLALRVAGDLLDEYPDGAWLVELAALADPSFVVQAVALAVGLSEHPDQLILATLVDYLKRKRLLLVLDNCEHLVEACARLAESLLRTCPTVTVLATSREALRIPGEVSWRVPSLSTPSPEPWTSPEDLTRYESVRLFVERATDANPSFRLTSQHANAVAQICWRLDGIPLALELAAARVRMLTPEQIARRLDDSFRVLTGGSRTVLPRQQTLKATVDWSHDLLTEPERVLFRRLAVFVGGWGLEAAEDVCADELLSREEVFDLLSLLAEKSLVLVEDVAAEARYRLLETIRQYAWERLDQAGESRIVRDRHRDWCLVRAEQAEYSLETVSPATWRQFVTEYPNLRAALKWCLDGDGKLGLRLAGALWQFWWKQGLWTEGRGWLEVLLARTTDPTVTGAKASLGLAFLIRMTQPHQAWTLAERSLSLFQKVGDSLSTGWTLHLLGILARFRGDRLEAQTRLLESNSVFRSIGYTPGIAMNLRDLGQFALHEGDLARAQALIEESLAILRVIGGAQLSDTVRVLGAIVRDQGDYGRARVLLEEALALDWEIGDRFRRAITLCHLGYLALLEGDVGLARAHVRQSKASYRQQGGGVEAMSAFALWFYGVLEIRHAGYARGTSLLGTVTTGTYIYFPLDRGLTDAALAAALAALGDEAFARAWAEGQAMTLEQAVEYALKDEAEE